ncbi:MAG: hypothetical protein R3F37_17395 [Candidatus Competibacteraceae bacterium]
MTESQTTKPPRERDPDLVNAEIALKRAALRAREKARQSGTDVAFYEDGIIKIEAPRRQQPNAE